MNYSSIRPEFQQWLQEVAVTAPSGDNLQPWEAEWREETLHLSIDPLRDAALYNFRHRADFIALGALIENCAIGAQHFGLTVDVKLLASGANDLLSATLTFQESTAQEHPLFPFISKRCTNRKPYRKAPLDANILETLKKTIPPDAEGELTWVTDPMKMKCIAKAASWNDRLLLESKRLHDGFFKTVRWTKEEAEQTQDGLDVRTLELAAPIGLGLKAFSSWNRMRFLNHFGASRMAPLGSYQTFLKSPAFGLLQMKKAPAPKTYVEGGRLLQRFWLTATSLGLSFQPMVGTLYLLDYLNPPGSSVFTPVQLGLLKKAEHLFKQALPLDGTKASILLFRMGYSDPPSATSLRRPMSFGRNL